MKCATKYWANFNIKLHIKCRVQFKILAEAVIEGIKSQTLAAIYVYVMFILLHNLVCGFSCDRFIVY